MQFAKNQNMSFFVVRIAQREKSPAQRISAVLGSA
jgi:hypothetical protein